MNGCSPNGGIEEVGKVMDDMQRRLEAHHQSQVKLPTAESAAPERVQGSVVCIIWLKPVRLQRTSQKPQLGLHSRGSRRLDLD
jgi:hypothetical protein